MEDKFVNQIQAESTAEYNELGMKLFGEENYSDACIALERAIEINDNPELRLQVMNNLGNCYVELQKYNEAIEILEQASKFEVDQKQYALTLNNLGTAYQVKGDFDKAMTIFQRACVVDSDNLVVLHALGVNFSKTGEYDLALEVFEKILSSKELDANQKMITLTSKGNCFLFKKPPEYTKALECYSTVIELAPDDSVVLYYLAKCYEQIGKKGEAIAKVEKYFEAHPLNKRNLRLLNKLATLYITNKMWEDAEKNISKVTDQFIDRNYWEETFAWSRLFSRLAQHFSHQGNNEKALFYFDRAIFWNDQNSYAHTYYALHYLKMNDIENFNVYKQKALDTAKGSKNKALHKNILELIESYKNEILTRK